MVDEDIGLMYDQVLEYLKAKQAYYADASIPDSEFSDYRDFDLTSAVDTIQRQIKNRPSRGEAATIKGYRDMRASTSEYDIRLMGRSDYWTDAAVEEQDNIDKWNYNKKLVYLQMNGKDAGN